MTLLERIDQFPPKLCRFLARKDHGLNPMTTREIAKAAGLAVSTVAQLSKMDSWSSVTVSTIVAYSDACGVDLLNTREQLRFWRRRRLAYIGRGNKSQLRMYDRLLSDLIRCGPKASAVRCGEHRLRSEVPPRTP